MMSARSVAICHSHGIATRPEVASVGLTQRAAEEQGIQILVGKIPYAGNSRAMTLLNTVGTVKVIAGATYREVLGVHIVGPHATELISEAALAIQAEATVEDLIKTIKLHPTLSEATVEAARDALGMALYIPKR
jgi:dihydrolipoamide dehydrogenase